MTEAQTSEGCAMGRIQVGRLATMSILAAALFITAGTASIRAVNAQARPPSLYERLGGVYSIATVVDDFIERLLANRTLNANPAINAARARVPKAGLKFHVTSLVCAATGGPCSYAGRSMRDAHEQLDITPAQWDAMVADFKATLDKFKIPHREQQELIAIVDTTKNDIVQASSASQR